MRELREGGEVACEAALWRGTVAAAEQEAGPCGMVRYSALATAIMVAFFLYRIEIRERGG